MAKKDKSLLRPILGWLDQNLLLILTGVLLIFIPLYPKIPLFSPIEAYIVRVRVEDILVLVAALAWLVQMFRKKIKWRTPLTWFIVTYALLGFLTILSSIFVIKTVPPISNHVFKTSLHFLRYLEYFVLFFVAYASINNRRQLKILLGVMGLTLLGVTIYGYGQKYHFWPVYSTMNREFSKGVRLYLTEHARVQSTFAGHYDLAAYLVILLPVLLAFAYQAHQRHQKIALFGLHFLGVWLLIVSAARTSFVAYALASGIVILLMSLRQSTMTQKIKWLISRLAGLWLVTIVLMASFGADIYERFVQVINSYPQIQAKYQLFEQAQKQIAGTINTKFKTQGKPDKTPPPNSMSTEEAGVLVASDERPTSQRPSDVYEDIPDRVEVATTSAAGNTQKIVIEKPRVWSENALRYGLSMAIRLDTLWPRAIQGFLRDPLFGSGYATLNKTSLTDFTIADSTDNNFLRTLGETGLLGFMAFYGAIGMGLWLAVKGLQSRDQVLIGFSIGYLGAVLGLLLNAFYIDVFAASKVAFTFWALTGLYLGYYRVVKTKSQTKS